MSKNNPNMGYEAKKVMNDLFGLKDEECDNLDDECSFVSPSFLRELREKEEKLKGEK